MARVQFSNSLDLKDKTKEDIPAILESLGLDWKVDSVHYRYTSDVTGLEYDSNWFQSKLLVNTVSGVPYGLASDRTVVQNDERYRIWFDLLARLGLKPHRTGAYKDKSGSWLVTERVQVNSRVGNVGDVIEYYLLLSDSHYLGKGMKVGVFENRLVCTNGLTNWVKSQYKVLSHNAELSAKVSSEEFLFSITREVENRAKVYDSLASTTLTKQQAVQQLIAAFGDPKKKVEDQPKVVLDSLNLYLGSGAGSDLLSAYSTAYGLLQSVSEYYNWHTKASWESLLIGASQNKIKNFEKQLVKCYSSSF